MFSSFLRKFRPGLRPFSNDPTIGLEISIKASRTNAEIFEFLKNPQVSPYHYALSLRVIGKNISKSSSEYEFVASSDFSSIKKQIETHYIEFSLSELAHIVYFIRILSNSQKPRVFDKEVEKSILSRANTDIEYVNDKALAIDLYLNLALIQATSAKTDAKILSYLRDPNEYFSISQLLLLLSGGYHSKKNSSKFLILETIRKLEALDISLLKNEELTDLLQILAKIDQRYSIGSVFLNNLLVFLSERVEYFDYSDFDNILGFYALSDDYDRSLLYQTLNAFENSLTNKNPPDKFCMLRIIHNLALLKKSLFIKLSPDLLEKINKFIEKASLDQKLGFVEMGRVLIDYSYLYKSLPENMEAILETFYNRGKSGM